MKGATYERESRLWLVPCDANQDEVFWEDPDLYSSGYYLIDGIRGDEGAPAHG